MVSIFLSHNAKDKPFVRRIAEDLKQYGLRVWVDEAEINVGDSLIKKVSEGIDTTDYLGVVISRNSVKSNWVQKELSLAMSKEIASKKVVVLPLLLEHCELPEFLRDKLYADFTDESRYPYELARLLRTMGVNEHHNTSTSSDTANFGTKVQGRLWSSNIILTYYGDTPRIHWDWEGWMESVHQSVLILAATVIRNTSIRQLTPPSWAKISLGDRTGLKVVEVNIHFTDDRLMFEYEGVYGGYEGFHLENPTEEKIGLLWYAEFKDKLIYEKVVAQDTSSESYRNYLEMFVPYVAP